MRFGNLFSILPILLITACGGASEETDSEVLETRDNTAEVQAYYAANPDFFSFKDMADLPADLNWENGANLEEIGSPNALKGGTEYRRMQDFPRTLRTTGPDANGGFRAFLLDDVGVRLAHRHPNEFDFYPGLAEAWSVDKENKTVYVKLDPKARFSDGEPVTTDDFMFMFFFFRSSYILEPWYNNWYTSQYTNITKFDDHTFSVSIPNAKPDMDYRVLDIRPIPEHFYKELGDDFVDRYQWQFEPTTAAYVIKDEGLRKGRSVTFSRLENWWAKDKKHWRYRYNTDKIHLSVIRDTAKHFEAFKRGDIDQFNLRLADFWYEKLPNNDPDVADGYIQKSVFYNQRPRPTFGLWLNTSRAMLDNKDVRVGINHAANWQLVIDNFFRGDYARMRTSSDGYGQFSEPNLAARPFDVEKAQAAFARAGFTKRGPDGILVNEAGERLSFTLSSGYESYKDILTILKEEAVKAGLEVRIELLDSTAAWKKVQEKKHDIHFSAFSVSLEMYPRFWETYHSDNAYEKAFLEDGSINPDRKLITQTNNLEAFALPEMDRMIEAYRASDDLEEMIRLAQKMTVVHHNHASFVPGFVQPSYRLGHWRWVNYPEGFNYKHSRDSGELYVHWIDTAAKEATLAAKKSGATFEPQINVFDQFATP
jgi:microcin C transport system substrate-binding protein